MIPLADEPALPWVVEMARHPGQVVAVHDFKSSGDTPAAVDLLDAPAIPALSVRQPPARGATATARNNYF